MPETWWAFAGTGRSQSCPNCMQSVTKLSPVGTAENSPGRQSWVSHVPTSSPVGTAENVPGCNPGLLSPQHGLFAIRGSHPGLASWDILVPECGDTYSP